MNFQELPSRLRKDTVDISKRKPCFSHFTIEKSLELTFSKKIHNFPKLSLNEAIFKKKI